MAQWIKFYHKVSVMIMINLYKISMEIQILLLIIIIKKIKISILSIHLNKINQPFQNNNFKNISAAVNILSINNKFINNKT
jgi:polyribonucleotide nucleotidyltransferase